MLVCVQCRSEMRCRKNSVGYAFSPHCTYPGDVFECNECGFQVLKTNERAAPDPTYSAQGAYVFVNEIDREVHQEKEWKNESANKTADT